jgi:hypothetical protein
MPKNANTGATHAGVGGVSPCEYGGKQKRVVSRGQQGVNALLSSLTPWSSVRLWLSVTLWLSLPAMPRHGPAL